MSEKLDAILATAAFTFYLPSCQSSPTCPTGGTLSAWSFKSAANSVSSGSFHAEKFALQTECAASSFLTIDKNADRQEFL